MIEDQFLARWARVKVVALELQSQFYMQSTNEIQIKYRVLSISLRRFHENPIVYCDLLSMLDALDLYQDYSNTLEKHLKSWLTPESLKNGFTYSKTSLCHTIQYNTEGKGRSKLMNYLGEPKGATHLLGTIAELGKFISTALFTTSNRPRPSFLIMWTTAVFSVLEHSLATSNIDDMAFSRIEELLFDLGMISDEYEPKRLLFSTAFEEKRMEILCTVKEILESSDLNTWEVSEGTERGGIAGILGRKVSIEKSAKAGKETLDTHFNMAACHVSAQAQSVIEIVYTTLNEMVESDPSTNIESWMLAKACLDLVRLQEPVEPSGCSARSLIRYNDCNYIAHHLSTIGIVYQTYLPKQHTSFVFLDQVSPFYSVGQEALQTIMNHQYNAIDAFYQNADNSFESSNVKAAFLLKSLSKSWKVWKVTDVSVSLKKKLS